MKQLSKSPRINEALSHLAISSYFDVLYHLPRTYDNFAPTRESNLDHKERVVLIGKLAGPVLFNRHQRVKVVTFPFVTKNHISYRIVAFNRPYLLNQLKNEEIYTLVGIYNRQKHEINLVNLVRGEMEPDRYLKPIYSLPMTLANHEYLRLVRKSFKLVGESISNDIPQELVKRYRFISEKEALAAVHFPQTIDDVYQGLRVLKYRECLLFSLKTQLIRAENKLLKKGLKAEIDLQKINDFILTLPYKLTTDQVKAIREIVLDMNQQNLMYRLLQGDVGTGKTLVAEIALFANYLRGDQGALMAPTDALAQQHFQTLSKLFSSTNIRIGLLTGNISLEEKNKIKNQLSSGEIDIAVGTHALFSSDVFYHSLGLAVIDEQHRFGVNQRGLLAAKGERSDLLLMSATPIPRTLALTLYGDLEVTTLMQFPQQKRDVITKIFTSDSNQIHQEIKKTLAKNEQIFVVAPLIEEGNGNRSSVEALAENYLKHYPQEVQVLHGKLNADEKQIILQRFKNGEKPILISTTVIEVGIDVGSASLMIIYDAASFGLAALHQLRGRIGRQGQRALCMLLSDNQTEDEEKLQVLVNSNDGFYIAEADLRLRGPGEMSGLKQAGLPNFQYVNIISDFAMFDYACKDASEILAHPKDPENIAILQAAQREIKYQLFTNV